MPVVQIDVRSSYEDVIKNQRKAAQAARQDMESINRQAQALLARGVPAAQVRSAVATAQTTSRERFAAAAGTLPANRQSSRLAEFTRLEGQMLRSMEQTLAASNQQAASARQSAQASRRQADADQRSARAAEDEARARTQSAAQQRQGIGGSRRSMRDLLADARVDDDARRAQRERRQARQSEIQRLAADEGISTAEARRAVQDSEAALRAYFGEVDDVASRTLRQLAAQLESEYGILIREGPGGRDVRQNVRWNDEDTRMALGLGLADPRGGRRGQYQLPDEMRRFFRLIDTPSTQGALGVDPTDPNQVRRATRFDTMVADVGRAGTGLQGEVNDVSGALARLREMLDTVNRLRAAQSRAPGTDRTALGLAGDPFIPYALGAQGQGPYAMGMARRQFARDYEGDQLAEIERLRGQESRVRSQAAREAREAAEREGRESFAALAPNARSYAQLADPVRQRADEAAERRRERAERAREQAADRAIREQERAAARAAAEEERRQAKAAKEAAAAYAAMEREVTDVTARLGRMGVETSDLASRFGFGGGGGGGGRGGPPPTGTPGGPDDPFERLRQYLEQLQRRLSAAVGSGAVPPESVVREYGQAADDPRSFQAEQERRAAYFYAQEERRRQGQQNIFDARAIEEGISRRAGLQYGLAYEQEFRRRDLAGAGGSPVRGLFAGGEFGPEFLRSIGVDPDSDLGLRTLKDIMVREREAREEIVDQLTRQANTEEREQRAYRDALRRLTTATQAAAATRAADRLVGGDGRSLRDVEAESRAEAARAKALDDQADIDARRRLGVNEAVNLQQVAARVEAQQNRLMVSQRLESNQEYIQAQAATIASERRLQAAVNQQAQQMLRDDPGVLGGGTRFQRVQQALAGRTGGSPRAAAEYQQLGQFLQSRFLTTAGFAVSGYATYFAQAQIREIIREATTLQTEFRIIQGVLEDVGQTGEGAFDRVRSGILQVARDTGTAADIVAQVQQRLAGAFADPETLNPDFERARVESESGFRLARITGLPEREINDSLTAITLAYERTGVNQTFEQTSDLLLGLARQFGATETEIVRFTADLAPLAAELGLSARELSTFGAAMQAASGMGGGALAEQLGRILPGLQQRASEVVQIFDQIGSGPELARAFGAGDISKVLQVLLRDYNQLNDVQQNQLASLVGGRREAGAFFNLLGSGDAILRSLSSNTDDFAGTLDTRFGAVTEGFQFSVDQLERAVEELGIALFEGGLGDALVALADAGRIVADVFAAVFEVFGQINSLAGGLPAKVIGLALAFEALRRAAAFGGGIVQNIRGTGPAAPGSQAGANALFSQLGVLGQAAGLGAQGPAGVAARQAQAAQQAQQRQQSLFRRLIRNQSVQAGGIFGAGYLLSAGASAAGQQDLAGIFQGAGVGAGIGSFGGPVGMGIGAVAGGGLAFFQQQQERQRRAREIRAQQARGEGPYAYEDALRRLRLGQQRDGDTAGPRERQLDEALQAMREGAALSEEELALIDEIVQEQIARNDPRFTQAGQSPADRIVAEQERASAQRRLNFEEAMQRYEAGVGGQGEVLRALNDELEAVNGQIEGALEAGADTTDFELQRLQILQQRQQFLADSINERFDLTDRIAEAFGGSGANREADLSRARQRLTALQQAGADPAAVTEAAFAVVDAQRAMLDQQVANAETTAEQLAIANRGLAVDAEAAAAIADAQIRSALGGGLQDRLTALFARISDSLGGALQTQAERWNSAAEIMSQMTAEGATFGEIQNAIAAADQATAQIGLSDSDLDEMIRLVIATGNAETAAVIRVRDAIVNRMREIFELLRAGLSLVSVKAVAEIPRLVAQLVELSGLINEIESYAPPERIQGDTQGIQDQAGAEDAADDLARRIAEARLAVRRAQANGDPRALAQLAVEAARIQIQFAKDEAERLQGLAALIEAGNQQRQAYIDIQNAAIELRSARTEDPLAQASYAVQLAQRAINFAQGEAARLRAMAQKAQADRAFRDAIRDIANSRVELVMAMARAAGDDVAAAEAALQLARQQLDRARAEGAGEAAINRAQADVIEAQAGLRDAQLASRRADIEFALDMGRATVAQAIAQLQALLQIPGLTEQQTRDILLRIRQLRDGLNQDLAFNLPSDLRLPTLYEARRALQSQQAGQNYQAAQVYTDARTISIQLNATNAEAVREAVGTIIEAVEAPPREGQYTGILR